jgi:hypothetical protein
VLDKKPINVVVNADHRFAPITIANPISKVISPEAIAVRAIIITHALVCMTQVSTNPMSVNQNNHQCAYADISNARASDSTLVFIYSRPRKRNAKETVALAIL